KSIFLHLLLLHSSFSFLLLFLLIIYVKTVSQNN
ncbi:unnamed protein product, partial [Brassica oleracea]